MHVQKTHLLALALLFWCAFFEKMMAQTEPLDDPILREIVEEYAKRNALLPDFDAHQLLEHLEILLEKPLDLNRASRADLENLWLLDEAQIAAFLGYRTTLGPLVALEELQAVPNWELDDIRRVRPFIKIGGNGLDGYVGSRKSLIFNGKNELLFRQTRRFDSAPTLTEPVAGSPDGLLFRFKHTHDGRLSYGLTAEKDAGESFFRADNRAGFDFYSAHFFAKNWSKNVRAVALGDFKVNFGQGLVMASGFGFGKSSRSLAIKKSDHVLRPHSSAGEDFFERGAAVTLGRGSFETTIFTSLRRRDAGSFSIADSLKTDGDEATFGAFLDGGMHRTKSEIAGEKRVGEWLSGTSVQYENRRFQIGFNSVFDHFDKAFEKLNARSEPFVFHGKSLISNSLSYETTWRNLHFFGETAVSQNGGTASLNGLLVALDRRVSLAVLQRNYGRAYQTFYGQAFGETRETNNERGFYAGLEIRPSGRWILNGFADLWRHDWPRAGLAGPSGGREMLAAATYSIRKKLRLNWTFRHEIHEALGEAEPIFYRKNRLRFQAEIKFPPSFEWRNRVEIEQFRGRDGQPSNGFLMYQDLIFEPKDGHFSWAARLLFFQTDDFAARIFAFEQHLTASQFVPSFSGKGVRIFARGEWRPRRNWSLEAFVGRLVVVSPDRDVWELKTQARYFF